MRSSTPTTSSSTRIGIERPKARRNEGGFTIGGPIIKDRFFFFGGYQHTNAETGFVTTASSITVLPAALSLISGERTKENLFAAFRQLNPGIVASIPKAQCNGPADRNCISDVAVRLLNLRNPATGDFLHPSATGRKYSRNRYKRYRKCGGKSRTFVNETFSLPSSSRISSRSNSMDG